MSRPRLLDLFCCAGGAAMGYHRAGFDVIGVDVQPQPRYPFEFVQADWWDALFDLAQDVDAIHASPPCQGYSAMTDCRPGRADDYPQLIARVRDALSRLQRPWVIENVARSPLAIQSDLLGAHGIELCGAMFGLPLYRHRLFESSFPIAAPAHPRHLTPASKAGHWRPGTIISVAGNCYPVALAREAMGIDWTTRDELAEAIPPAYTEFIGEQLLAHIAECAA